MSPWALTWNHENYYLIAYDEKDNIVKHFRVDKMGQISIKESPRSKKNRLRNFNAALYTKENFEMFSGEEKKVRIAFENDLVGVFIDTFGRDIPISKAPDGRLITDVILFVSPQFYGFLFGLGDKAEIMEPQEVRNDYLKQIGSVQGIYKSKRSD